MTQSPYSRGYKGIGICIMALLVVMCYFRVSSEPCRDAKCDSLLVRKLLEMNDINDIPIDSIAPGIGLGRVIQLFLNNRNIDTLPEEIGNLEKLYWLNLEHNHLSSLPQSFSKLTELWELNLGNNRFTAYPEVIIDLWRASHNLRVIWLDSNYITQLPDSVVSVEVATHDVHWNRICTSLSPRMELYFGPLFYPQNCQSKTANTNSRHTDRSGIYRKHSEIGAVGLYDLRGRRITHIGRVSVGVVKSSKIGLRKMLLNPIYRE